MSFTIETPRLVLRQWRDADVEAYVALNADPVVMEHFPAPLTREESESSALRIRERIHAQGGWGLWAVEVRGGASFIGFIGLQPIVWDAPFAPAVEIGWRLAHAHWGSGYAPEGARAALEYGFDQLGLREIVAMTVTRNERSQRVMDKLGMKRDPAGDFDHPRVPEGPCKRHFLYRLREQDYVRDPGGPTTGPASLTA